MVTIEASREGRPGVATAIRGRPMTDRERLDVLRGVAELDGASDEALRSLVPFFDEICLPADVVLVREGRLAHEFFVVAAGELEVCRHGRASALRTSESFGWTAMRERGHHDATVVTMSPARLLVMSHAQFRAVAALAAATRPS